MNDKPLIIRMPEVIERTGLCRSTIYELLKKNDMPQRIKLRDSSTYAVGWLRSDIDHWLDSRTTT